MAHLMNCHGELTFLLATLPSLPIIGSLAFSYFKRGHSHGVKLRRGYYGEIEEAEDGS